MLENPFFEFLYRKLQVIHSYSPKLHRHLFL